MTEHHTPDAASGTDRGEKPANIQPGELLWICYQSMFGQTAWGWADLPTHERVKWGCVAEGFLKEVPASQAAPVAGVAWLPMKDAPTGVPIIAKHKPNARMPLGWVGTIKLGHGDEEETDALDTILHYNGDSLIWNFHGCWEGWVPIGAAEPIAPPPGDPERLDLTVYSTEHQRKRLASRVGPADEDLARVVTDAMQWAEFVPGQLVPAFRPDGTGGRDQTGIQLGARVRKTKGSSWQGVVVGYYATALTPRGVCVESEREPGSVQIYPIAALEPVEAETPTHPTSPQGGEVKAPQPDPVGEAKALLDKESICRNPWAQVKWLRLVADQYAATTSEQRAFLDRADAIEAALATIRSSQAGEVRDDA
ncbi:R67 dihydrofolate reductase [Methylobacterium pseudosasicola]|uniref:R67 dihydrofolate reductase n=1 Tax=Methylobacterium pseudosasicola TaxID=582667 RepID=A0A1I4V6W3_9HYPH|nr:R67 dihydrofolate reductase [Methylobacterium pseudosasicola]